MLNPTDQRRAAQIRALRQQGWSIASIARLLLMPERAVRRLVGVKERAE